MKIGYAEFVKVGYCGECDGLHLQLHDEDGAVFAVAILDPSQADQIAKEAAAFVEHGAAARCSVLTRGANRLQ